MKRILSICLLMSSIVAFAQAESHHAIGVQVGFTQPISRLNSPVPGYDTKLTPTIYNGLKVGIVYEETIVKGFGYTIGLNYTFAANATDWMKQETGQPSLYPQVRSRGQYHQLEIPVDWQYKFQIADNTYLMLYTGPTLQCGLALNDKWYVRMDNQSDALTLEENLYSKEEMGDYTLDRLNVTWGVGAGFQYDRYFLRGGYDFGILNPYKEATFQVSDEYSPYTRGRFDQWQIKIGMYLWEK